MGERDDDDLAEPSDEAATTAWESLFTARLTSRQRLLRLAVIIGAPLLALIVILGGNLSFGQTRPPAIASPSVTPGPAYNHLYLDVEVPWLRVTLDGQPIHPPAIYEQPPITLAPGRHVLSWQGAPFSAHVCTITIPPVGSDTCEQYVVADFYAQGFTPARVLNLGEALSTVQPGYKAQLISAIQAALSATGGSDTVPVGDLIVDEQGPTAATQPLTATLEAHAVLDTTTLRPNNCQPADTLPAFPECAVSTTLCADLCPVPYVNRLTLPDLNHADWLALVPYHPSYTYISRDGQVDLKNQPLEYGGKGVGAQLAVVAITWDGATWRVAVPYGPNRQVTMLIQGQIVGGNPNCLAANDLFSGGLDPQIYASFGKIHIISAVNPAQGCVVEGIVGNASHPPAAARALYLERFGVFYAANALAAKDQPYAPMASAADQALAEQIARQTGQTLNL